MIIPLICTEKNYTTKEDNLRGFAEAPEKIICPKCNEITCGEYRIKKNECNCCFVCCIPCGSSNPYIACKKCQYSIGGLHQYFCHSCRVITTYQSKYCTYCGKRK